MTDIIYGAGATITGLSGSTITCSGACPGTPGDISNASHNIVIQAGATVNAGVFAGQTIAASFDIQDGTIDPSAFINNTWNGSLTISGGIFSTAANNTAFQNSTVNAAVTISNGNFTSTGGNSEIFRYSIFNPGAPLTITGGSFFWLSIGSFFCQY